MNWEYKLISEPTNIGVSTLQHHFDELGPGWMGVSRNPWADIHLQASVSPSPEKLRHGCAIAE